MEIRSVMNEWLLECENLHFTVEVVDDKNDDAPFLLRIQYEGVDQVDQWMRISDINTMLAILNKAKRERKRLIGDK